jgi:protein-S-isoprenylcysteine O-methyltransferase Ste14
LVKLGGWLFKHRTALPLPIAIVLLAAPSSTAGPTLGFQVLGVALVVTGEAIRLWAVRHIGVISRTRSDRLGPLVDTGPFALVRNPLYVGNIALWTGFALSARILWMVPAVVLLLAFEYHAIVRWEETLLEARRGEEYRRYAARVPRWMPSFGGSSGVAVAAPHSWGATFFSERGTLIAIAVGYVLIWAKSNYWF